MSPSPRAGKDAWHAMTAADVLAALASDPKNGLTPEEAAKRLEQYGPNHLPEQARESLLRKFLKQFHNVLIYVLLAAALVTFFTGHPIDTAVILAVVLINAGIGFFQESRAEAAMDGIRNILALSAHVMRGGKRSEVPAADLTPGDIVRLKPGDKVPADLRLIGAENLKIEESALTGEAVPADKTAEAIDADAGLGDRANMAFSGTSVAAGTGVGVVARVGGDTEIGGISRMLGEVETPTTPLLKKMDQLSTRISIVILVIAAGVYLFGHFFRDYDRDVLALSVIGLAIAAIPEGLPAIMSIILALGVQSMARRNAIVRDLPSVETLGSVTVICSDKTGTLTKNEMTVTNLATWDSRYQVEGGGYAPEGAILEDGRKAAPDPDGQLAHLLRCFALCNESELSEDDKGRWSVKGEPTEGALLAAAAKAGLAKVKAERLDTIPFDSARKFMAVLAVVDGEKLILAKGAPDRLLDLSSGEETRSGALMTDASYWREEVSRLAKQGQRTIAAAYRKAPEDMTEIEPGDVDDLTILGLAGIVDPPRPEAIAAIEECQDAGITVKMITGDHAETALAIAESMGICMEDRALTGRELDAMDEAEFRLAAARHNVFARTSPANKLQLVNALQASGEVCAMTGDGVNDAPALKQADVGIAMGIKGTEVTKEAAKIVLADDNFSTIAAAVEEGRKVYDNLKKTILFILPTNGAECFLIMASILFGTFLPLTPLQILWVNMVTSVTVSMALAFEPLDPDVMEKPPRDPAEPLVDGYFVWRIFYVSALIGGGTLWLTLALSRTGSYDDATLRTITMQAVVFAQMFHLFNNRSLRRSAFCCGFFTNKAVFVVGALMVVLQLLVTYVPFMNRVFGTSPIPARYWVYPLILGLAVFVVVEIEKGVMRAVDRRRHGIHRVPVSACATRSVGA